MGGGAAYRGIGDHRGAAPGPRPQLHYRNEPLAKPTVVTPNRPYRLIARRLAYRSRNLLVNVRPIRNAGKFPLGEPDLL